MTTTEARFKDYVLPVLRQPRAPVDNLIFDELGQAVLAKHNERFRGIRNIEDNTEYRKDQPISDSNAPRVLSYNQILREETNGRIRVLSPIEVVRYWDSIPERDATHADTDSIPIFPKEGPNEDLRKIVLGLIDKKDTKIPLLVSGLGVEKADNGYGFTFTRTDFIDVLEAPFLTEDGFVTYDPKKGLVKSDKGVRIWVPNDQSGLRRAFRDGNVDLYFWGGRLLDSYPGGRVQVIQDPKGRAENLEGLVRR